LVELYKGDCLEVMKTIKDNSIDAIITDPPYGTTACKWDSVIPFDLMWEQLNRIIKPNGAIVLFGSEPFSSALRMSNIKNYKYDWKWDKVRGVGFQIAKYRPMMRTEDIIIFTKKGKLNYYPIMEKRDKIKKAKCHTNSSDSSPLKYNDNKVRTYTHNHPTNIITVSNASQKGKQHPTQKPILLMEYLIKTYTNENETVLDFTMGSGSTMVACQNTNRNGIGIEMDDNYFEVAKKRIEDNKMKLF
jgi:DNA modification methylase